MCARPIVTDWANLRDAPIERRKCFDGRVDFAELFVRKLREELFELFQLGVG